MPLCSASAGLKESKPRDALRADANYPSEKAPRDSTLPPAGCPPRYPCRSPHGAGREAPCPVSSLQCHDFQPRVHRSCAVCYSILKNYFVLKPVDGCICCCFVAGWFVLVLKFALNTPAAVRARSEVTRGSAAVGDPATRHVLAVRRAGHGTRLPLVPPARCGGRRAGPARLGRPFCSRSGGKSGRQARPGGTRGR